jgi:16S rRNA G966 N2-methylase RsmD
LRTLPAETTFDVIVLDPPYDAAGIEQTLDAAAARLARNGVLVLEHATRREPDTPPSLRHMRNVKSGDSTLTFLERRV